MLAKALSNQLRFEFDDPSIFPSFFLEYKATSYHILNVRGMVDQSPGPSFLDHVELVPDRSKPLLSLVTSHHFMESGCVRESDILGQG